MIRCVVCSICLLALLSSTLILPLYKQDISVNYKQSETGPPTLPPMSANWVATDGAGRTLPSQALTGNFKRNKYVGMFYFLLHGQSNDRVIYDVSTIMNANPAKPKFGPEAAWHWWGEPEVGYFKADDPWVLRRNLQLLALAGVDILFLDVTNAELYLPTVNKLCELSTEMRRKGIRTPYICFVTYTKSAQTVTALYQQFYAQKRFSELWFRWQDKPLMLGKIEEMADPSIRDFFTWRYSWAWTNARSEPHHWQWIDRTPQNFGWDKDPSIPEEMPVSVASHPYDNGIGKSFRQGREGVLNQLNVTSQTSQGVYFDEQWKRALQINPSVIFVTGWNEWIAQRGIYRPDPNSKDKPPMFIGKPLKGGQTFFIDLYNQEYNRDIDPMKGGYTDNYYYQLVANIRRFKGTPPPEVASSPQTITIDGNFGEWASVKPDFDDPTGDVAHRNWPRVDQKANYINNTGRNDIINCRVTYDKTKLYFYAKTDKKLTPSTDKNWMLLFIDTDQSAKTGWSGYDLLIRQSSNRKESTVNAWNGKAWKSVALGQYRYRDNELEVSVPRSIVQRGTRKLSVDFHWADNIQQVNKLSEFFLNGDSAPDRRFNYRYIGK